MKETYSDNIYIVRWHTDYADGESASGVFEVAYDNAADAAKMLMSDVEDAERGMADNGMPYKKTVSVDDEGQVDYARLKSEDGAVHTWYVDIVVKKDRR